MIEMVSALSSQQQTLWATIAQVDATVVIALVVEIGAAARRYKARAALEEDLRTLVAIALNFVALLIYVGSGAAAVAALTFSLAVLQSGANASAHDSALATVWTLIAVFLALVGPLLALAQYVLGTFAEGVIDFVAIARTLAARRKKKRGVESSTQAL